MSKEDIDKAVKEAASFAAADKERKENVDIRNTGDSTVMQIKKALTDAGDKISADEKSKVEADLKELEDAVNAAPVESITKDQAQKIKDLTDKVLKNAQGLFSKLYEQSNPGAAGATGGAGAGATGSADAGSTNNGSSNPDDNIVDGDFKEV